MFSVTGALFSLDDLRVNVVGGGEKHRPSSLGQS